MDGFMPRLRRTGLVAAEPISDSRSRIPDRHRQQSASPTQRRTARTSEASYTLGAGLQKAAYLDQAPWNLPLNFQGTFTFTSTVPIAVVALQLYNNERGEPLITTLPVIDTNARADSTPALLSQFADGAGWSTTLILVNQTETAQAGTIVFRDHSGNVVTLTANSTAAASFAYSIPKHSSFKLQTQGGGPNIQVGSATVTPDADNSTPVPLSI